MHLVPPSFPTRILSRAIPVLLVATLLAGPALADNTLYFTKDSLTTATPTLADARSETLDGRPLFGPDGGTVYQWDYTLKAGGKLVPQATHFVLNVSDPTPVPASVFVEGVANACSWYLEIDLPDYYFWYCSGQYQNSVLDAGTHPLDFDWGSDLEAQSVTPGTVVSIFLTTSAVSRSPSSTLKLDLGHPEDAATMDLGGTNEPLPVDAAANATAPPPGTSGGAPKPASTTSSSGPKPTTTSAPPAGAKQPEAPAAPGDDNVAEPTGKAPAKGSPALPTMAALGALGIVAWRRRSAGRQ